MPRTRHGLHAMRRRLTTLTTRRLDGRSAVAVAVRNWKAEVRADLGGDLTRAQETILEAAPRNWVNGGRALFDLTGEKLRRDRGPSGEVRTCGEKARRCASCRVQKGVFSWRRSGRKLQQRRART